MKGFNSNTKYRKPLNRKVSSDSMSSSLMKTTISIFKNRIDYSLLNQNEKNLNSTKKSGKSSFILSEKKNSTQLPKKRYDIKKYNNIIKESNKSRFLESFYNPNPKYKLYLNNSSLVQASLNTRKSDSMALYQKQLNSRKKRISNNSSSQNIPNSFRRQTIEDSKTPIRNLLLFSTKNKNVNNKRNKIFDRQNIKIENYQFKRKHNSINEEYQNYNNGKYSEKKINIFNKRSSDNNLLNKIINNQKIYRINRISLNKDRNEIKKRNSMNDISREKYIDLNNINKNKKYSSIFLKNNINENGIRTSLNKNNIKIISKINSNNEIQSSTHKNSFISFENIYKNEIKNSSDKNINNYINNDDNINNYENKKDNINNSDNTNNSFNKNNNVNINNNENNKENNNDNINIDLNNRDDNNDNLNNNENNRDDNNDNINNNENNKDDNNDKINNNENNKDNNKDINNNENNKDNNKDINKDKNNANNINNEENNNDNKSIADSKKNEDNKKNDDNKNIVDNKKNDDNIINKDNNNKKKITDDNKNIDDNKSIVDSKKNDNNDNINNIDNNKDNKKNNDNKNNNENINNNDNNNDDKNDDNKNNNENIDIGSKKNSICSSINSFKKNEIIPESKRNSIYSSIHSFKKNEIIPESKRNSIEMIEKKETNNIINRNSIDWLNNIDKNENSNNEKDDSIDIKKKEDNNKEEDNKKNADKIISFNNINNDNENKDKKNLKKKVCFSTRNLIKVKDKRKENKENKENKEIVRVGNLKNRNYNKSTTSLFSFESDSQNASISDLSKEELKRERKSFKKKSRRETINLTKKLLVENTKEKLKIINRYIKENKSSLLIQNKFHNLKNKKYKFLNKIRNDIDHSILNRNNNNMLHEKVKLLKYNIDNLKSIFNEFKIDKKDIYDINITEVLDEIYEKNNDLNSSKINFNLIIPCNINYKLSKYIFRNIEFKGVFRNQFIEEQNKYEIIKKKSSRISMLSFPSLKKNKLLVSNLERFLVDKTNLIRKDEDSKWKKEKYNFMMVHNFKIKSLSWAKNENALIINKTNEPKFEVFQRNDYKSNVRNTLHVSKRKIIGISRISVTSTIDKKINRGMLKKKTISLFKRPSLDLRSSVKKKEKRRKNFNKISILKNKTFFNRKNETNINYPKKKSSIFVFDDIQDESEDNKINNENKDMENTNLEHPKSIDDVYFGLTLLIAKGKENQFRKYYNKYEKILDIDFPIYEGNTLLMMSTKEGMAGITRFLCEKKADVNLKNDRGNTALHYAIGQRFYKIVDILTIFGAREDILNNKGLSPWDC